MVKASKWLKNFFTIKKEKEKEKIKENEQNEAQPLPIQYEKATTPIQIPTSREKKRWSFRRSAAGTRDLNSSDVAIASAPTNATFPLEIEQKRHALAVAAATAAAAEAAVAAAQAAAEVIQLTSATKGSTTSAIEEAAVIKIQSVFRSYLARKALRALRGLVKLQALVRGHLVRKQATTTLRCMQALLIAQAKARLERIRMVENAQSNLNRQTSRGRSPHRSHQYYVHESSTDDNAKVVEIATAEARKSKSRPSYSAMHGERTDQGFAENYRSNRALSNEHQHFSPAPSGITDMSPQTYSGHFDDFSFTTAQSSPQHEATHSMSYDYSLYPNYMANTQSSRAKVRSQSAPKQRPESYERQSSRRRLLTEGRNIPKCVKMQRSSSNISSTAYGFHYPWHLKLDGSNMSVKESECGSTSTILTGNNFCRYPAEDIGRYPVPSELRAAGFFQGIDHTCTDTS